MSDKAPVATAPVRRDLPAKPAARFRNLSLWETGLMLLLALASIAGASRLAIWSATEQVSFDGAMNLEVARSLAEGHGYQRLYAGHSGFSHEIQSRAPYILPAAAVFAAFGVGIWQAQLTNLLYAAALIAVVFLVVRRWTSWRWGLFALAVCLWTPGICAIAMNGYGEVPALVWWLAAVLVLCPTNDAPLGSARLFGAGALIGLAVLTKTVLAIGLVAIVPLIFASLAPRRSLRSAAAGLVAFVCGLLLPALLYEIAHVVAIGDYVRWRAWLKDEMHAIHMQAGTEGGFKDTHGILAKLLVHSRLLADSIGLPLPLLTLWIVGPIALAVFGRRWFSSAHARAAVLGLALFAAIYFLWWLGFTPTEKAWYRRVFNGVLVLEILLIVVLSALWKLRERTVGSPRHLAAIACFVLVALQVPLAWSNWDSDDGGDFASRESLPADLAALQRVPANAQVYGVAWYSAPNLALYSGRRFDNIATKTPLQLAAASPVFLALDMQAQNVGAAQYWLDRYSNREIARSNSLRLVELDATTPLDPFRAVSVDDGAVLSRVDFRADDYAYVFGFQNREGDGWRWASADAEVLLRYRGEREFNVDVYVPPLRSYRFKKDVGVTVWIGACRLGTFRQNENRRERWWLPAANCPLQPGERVAVRLTSDNLYESRDERQLAYIVHSLGFAEPLASTSTGPADSR